MGLGVEGAHAGHRPLGGEVAGNEVCGPLGVGETHHPPFLHRRLVAPGGLLGLHGEGQPPHPGSELSGGEVLCLLQHGVGHTAGLCLLQVRGALTDHPGPGQIDPTPAEGLPHPGEPLEEVECQPEVAVGGSPGETEGRSDLLGGELVDRWHPLRRGGIGGTVGHLGHGGVELGLVEGDLRASTCSSVTTSSPHREERSMPARTTPSPGPGGISAKPSGSGTALGSERSSSQFGASPSNVIIISATRFTVGKSVQRITGLRQTEHLFETSTCPTSTFAHRLKR